jgi:hypothetical protein
MNEFEERLEECISAQQAKIEKIKVGHFRNIEPRSETDSLHAIVGVYRVKRGLPNPSSKKRFKA